jgi:hypothetical protein
MTSDTAPDASLTPPAPNGAASISANAAILTLIGGAVAFFAA